MFSVVLRVMNGNGYNPREVVDVPLVAKDDITQIYKDNEREVYFRSETCTNRDDRKVIARIRTMIYNDWGRNINANLDRQTLTPPVLAMRWRL